MSIRAFGQCMAFATLSTVLCAPAGSQQPGEHRTQIIQARMDSVLSSAYSQDGPGASVIAVRDGEVVFRKGYGLADLELGVPIEPNMLFRVASITKEFTAALVLQLVEEGVLSMDDEITKYLPDYPVQGHRVTIENLLTHTSGIPTFQRVPGFQDQVRLDHTLEETIAIFASQPFEFSPGERYSYSSSGYILLGAILEKATGKSYEELLAERIFNVAGMETAQLNGHDRIIPGRVDGYTVDHGEVVNMPIASMTMAYSSGGLLMSVDDLAKWDEALYGDQLLDEATRKAMWSPHILPNGQSIGYGFGWMISEFLGHPVRMHDGSLDGFLSAAWRLPEDHLFVAVLTNSDSPEVGPNVAAKEILGILLGIPKKVEIPMSQADLARYAGNYLRRDGRAYRVIQEGGKLFFAPNQNIRWEIRPESDTSFFFPEPPNEFNTVTFEFDESGAVTGLAITFDTGGQMSVQREGKGPTGSAGTSEIR